MVVEATTVAVMSFFFRKNFDRLIQIGSLT